MEDEAARAGLRAVEEREAVEIAEALVRRVLVAAAGGHRRQHGEAVLRADAQAGEEIPLSLFQQLQAEREGGAHVQMRSPADVELGQTLLLFAQGGGVA